MPQINGKDYLGRTTQQTNDTWRGSKQRPSVIGKDEVLSPQEAAVRRQAGIRGGNRLLQKGDDSRGYSFDYDTMFPAPPGGGAPLGGGYPRGGGGGRGGRTPIDMGGVYSAFGMGKPKPYSYQGYTPQQYADPKMYDWQDIDLGQFDAPEFRQFDGSQYDLMSQGVDAGLAADLAAGGAAYGDARTELSQYQNPFTNRQYTKNGPMPEAMERMLAANDAGLDQTETNRGVQADQAFGSVLALLGGTADQSQASALRALDGDERRFGESLASQGRSMKLGVGMKKAKAYEAYEREKFQYGVEVAERNLEIRLEQARINHGGQQQTSRDNTSLTNETDNANVDITNQAGWQNSQGENQATQATTQADNDWRAGIADQIVALIASGEKFDPAALTAILGG